MKELSTNLQSFSESLYKKMVLNKRGGWCHELNGLMFWALKELGFNMVVTFDSKNYMLDVGLGLVAVWVKHKTNPISSSSTS